MAKSKNSSSRLNRGSDMDSALFEALASDIPDKNTGPDPNEILGDIFESNEGADTDILSAHDRRVRKITVVLDKFEVERAGQIVELVRAQTGEQIDTAEAIRVALGVCEMDEQLIERAYQQLCLRERK